MKNSLKYKLSKSMGKLTYKILKLLPTGGKAYPGYVFIKFAGIDKLNTLTEEQIKNGSILITGTNGKTTTTTMIIDLLKKDADVTKSVDNNTVYALTTALLSKKGDIGVFEYGIRDIKNGQPDIVQQQVKPMGVVYTNISKEHTQVRGIKNPFNKYLKAKQLLSQEMKNGVVITNADDPNTAQIGLKKQEDGQVIFYGFKTGNIQDNKTIGEIKCPECQRPLNYKHVFMNQRGIYECECGFKRPEADIEVTDITITDKNMKITIKGEVYNKTINRKIPVNVNLQLPLFGIYNIYNVLAATTTYTCFTPDTSDIEEKLQEYFNRLDFTILPPGRFEIIETQDKKIGLGQGDNGDALNANVIFMKQKIGDEKFEFIYSTPDDKEEEIFLDHLDVIRKIKPEHITVVPGRISTDAAKKYYRKIKDEGFNCEFISIEYNFEKRIEKIIELSCNSDYKNIIITGCGEEQYVWNEIKKRLKDKAE